MLSFQVVSCNRKCVRPKPAAKAGSGEGERRELERTLRRCVRIDPSGRAGRNQLDRISGRHLVRLVPYEVHMIAAFVNERRWRGIDVGLAVSIVVPPSVKMFSRMI